MEREVREVLEAAFHDLFGREPDKVHDLEWLAFRDRERRFRRFLDAEAYTDAALMLVMKGAGFYLNRYWIASADGPVWSCEICTGGIPSNPRRVFDAFDAAHPALAIAQAALKTKDADHAR